MVDAPEKRKKKVPCPYATVVAFTGFKSKFMEINHSGLEQFSVNLLYVGHYSFCS